MSKKQHLGQCGSHFPRELARAIMKTRTFADERTAVGRLANMLDVGESVVRDGLRQFNIVFVRSRHGRVSVQLTDELRRAA